jgi:hypothetical protein
LTEPQMPAGSRPAVELPTGWDANNLVKS